MNTTELVAAVATNTDLSKKDAKSAIEAFFAVLSDEMAAGRKVSVTGLMAFEGVDRKGRKGRNPGTGAVIDIPAKRVPKVTFGK